MELGLVLKCWRRAGKYPRETANANPRPRPLRGCLVSRHSTTCKSDGQQVPVLVKARTRRVRPPILSDTGFNRRQFVLGAITSPTTQTHRRSVVFDAHSPERSRSWGPRRCDDWRFQANLENGDRLRVLSIPIPVAARNRFNDHVTSEEHFRRRPAWREKHVLTHGL